MFNFLKKKVAGEEVVLKIEGMHCSSCAMNIDGELEEIAGVVEARTSYAKAETRVVVRDGGVDMVKLKKAIERAGYKAVVVNH